MIYSGWSIVCFSYVARLDGSNELLTLQFRWIKELYRVKNLSIFNTAILKFFTSIIYSDLLGMIDRMLFICRAFRRITRATDTWIPMSWRTVSSKKLVHVEYCNIKVFYSIIYSDLLGIVDRIPFMYRALRQIWQAIDIAIPMNRKLLSSKMLVHTEYCNIKYFTR